MGELTGRQIQILKIIIEEYIETAAPVGSESLDKKYNLGVSPATIRNEMVKLIETGYLKQPYTSAGRVPTPKALKYYIHNLLEPRQLSVVDEVAVKEKIWDYRHQVNKLLRESAKVLAQKTKSLALAASDEGDIYFSGIGNILETPEFYDINLTRSVLDLLDRLDYWQKLFFQELLEGEFQVLLGQELGMSIFEPCGIIYTYFKLPKEHHGTIGVVGPYRLNYPYVIPIIIYMGNLISQISGGAE